HILAAGAPATGTTTERAAWDGMVGELAMTSRISPSVPRSTRHVRKLVWAGQAGPGKTWSMPNWNFHRASAANLAPRRSSWIPTATGGPTADDADSRRYR